MRSTTKRIGLAVAVLALVAGTTGQATAQSYSYNFTDYWYDSLSSLPGVDFSLVGGPGPGGIPYVDSFGQPAIGNSPTGEYPTSQQLVFTFTGGTASGVSFIFDNYGDNPYAPTTFSAYSPSNTLLYSQNVAYDNYVLETVPGSGIGSIVIDNGSGGNYSWEIGVYTLAFTLTPTSVPEPSSIVSAGIACLMGFGYAWRRRRKAIASA